MRKVFVLSLALFAATSLALWSIAAFATDIPKSPGSHRLVRFNAPKTQCTCEQPFCQFGLELLVYAGEPTSGAQALVFGRIN